MAHRMPSTLAPSRLMALEYVPRQSIEIAPVSGSQLVMYQPSKRQALKYRSAPVHWTLSATRQQAVPQAVRQKQTRVTPHRMGHRVSACALEQEAQCRPLLFAPATATTMLVRGARAACTTRY